MSEEKNNNWHGYYKKQAKEEEIQKKKIEEQNLEIIKKRKEKNKKPTYLGWISFFLVFTIKGIIFSILISIYAILSKKHDNTVAIIALIFAMAIIFILFIPPLFT